MPPNFYHCKYCLQVKQMETALNRHIAHSAPCFQSWKNELVRLTSSTTGVEGTLNCPSLVIDPSMLPDAWDNEVDVVYEELRADNDMPGRINQPSVPNRGSEPTEDIEDADDACSQHRYQKPYPGGDAAEILGEGMTKFQQWEKMKAYKVITNGRRFRTRRSETWYSGLSRMSAKNLLMST